jgi:hypothetical protein
MECRTAIGGGGRPSHLHYLLWVGGLAVDRAISGGALLRGGRHHQRSGTNQSLKPGTSPTIPAPNQKVVSAPSLVPAFGRRCSSVTSSFSTGLEPGSSSRGKVQLFSEFLHSMLLSHKYFNYGLASPQGGFLSASPQYRIKIARQCPPFSRVLRSHKRFLLGYELKVLAQ